MVQGHRQSVKVKVWLMWHQTHTNILLSHYEWSVHLMTRQNQLLYGETQHQTVPSLVDHRS